MSSLTLVSRPKLADRVRYYAKAQGIRLGDLMEATGQRAADIACWEHETRGYPRVDELVQMAEILNITVEQLMYEEYSISKEDGQMSFG